MKDPTILIVLLLLGLGAVMALVNGINSDEPSWIEIPEGATLRYDGNFYQAKDGQLRPIPASEAKAATVE